MGTAGAGALEYDSRPDSAVVLARQISQQTMTACPPMVVDGRGKFSHHAW